MKLGNSAYDILKWITMIVLPALGTFYFALAKIWGLPYGTEIVGTIAAVTTFLGALIGVSTSGYNALEEENAGGGDIDDPFADYEVGDEDADS